MNKYFPSEKIYAAVSKIVPTEKGVFAKKKIKQGEVIEICPIIAISADDTTEIQEQSLVTYMFYYGDKKEKSLIALGYGSLYNHLDTPNASYSINSHEETITFTALTDIKKDEEIAVNYAKNAENSLWFVNKT
ncbi:MAG TPA: SET domain-containing protein-lysine N-methyltransferase [Patescibacteria group bacterium]|nr:SET domain-containing protein-lysine N-methyltransferase [Patescibacteria group bacterium]